MSPPLYLYLRSCKQCCSISSLPRLTSQKTALSKHASGASWHQVSKPRKVAYGCTRGTFEAKRDELKPAAEAAGRARSPLPAATYIGVTWGHMSKMWSKTPLKKSRPPASIPWSCQNDSTGNTNNRGGLHNPSPLPDFSRGQGLQEGSLLAWVSQPQANSWRTQELSCSL